MEKLDKIHKINSKFTLNHNIMKKCPVPVLRSGFSMPEKCLLKFIKFQSKLFIAGGLVFYCSNHGLWGTPEQSYKFLNDICATFNILQ